MNVCVHRHATLGQYYLMLFSEQQQYGCPRTRGLGRDIGRVEFDAGSGLLVSGGKHVLLNDCSGCLMMEDQTKLYSPLENSTGNDWSASLPPSSQQYEIWNFAPLWRWNFSFND